MAQSDATYPVSNSLFLKHSSGLDEGYGVTQGSSLATGDLRRKYNFAERFSELAIDQTPFFRLVSKIAKRPTDDPSFKFTEKRQSWMKRYAYVVGYRANSGSDSFDNALFQAVKASSPATIAVGDTIKVWMATDYKSAGNIQNISGQSNSSIAIGSAGTAPEFFLPNQVIQINLASTTDNGGGATVISDYVLAKIDAGGVGAQTDVSDTNNTGGSQVLAGCVEAKLVTATVIKAASGELTSYSSDAPLLTAYDKTISSDLEAKRCYVVGNSHAEGSSLVNATWKDNPYSTGYGQTQIFRSEFGMTNTARATVLKYEPNEWARVWRDKLIEHKWEIEQTGLFGSQFTDASGVSHTQGAVDYITNYGNVFTWADTKTVDSFLDDMSSYVDPRYNQSKATVYFCDTEVYNWLHKLGGYFAQNIGIASETGGFRADLAVTGRKKVMGLDMTTISTPLGDMNVTRNIALDRSAVKILGINMSNVKYRPLVGNGMNRDTTVYVGVNSLETSGTDKRVDMILTEAGFEFQMPESHAVWS
jgi:hypothetical protein